MSDHAHIWVKGPHGWYPLAKQMTPAEAAHQSYDDRMRGKALVRSCRGECEAVQYGKE